MLVLMLIMAADGISCWPVASTRRSTPSSRTMGKAIGSSDLRRRAGFTDAPDAGTATSGRARRQGRLSRSGTRTLVLGGSGRASPAGPRMPSARAGLLPGHRRRPGGPGLGCAHRPAPRPPPADWTTVECADVAARLRSHPDTATPRRRHRRLAGRPRWIAGAGMTVRWRPTPTNSLTAVSEPAPTGAGEPGGGAECGGAQRRGPPFRRRTRQPQPAPRPVLRGGAGGGGAGGSSQITDDGGRQLTDFPVVTPG